MQHIPISNYGAQEDPAGLVLFLEDCRKRAAQTGKPQLVNISLDVFHIDPLAVLEAVYEPNNSHFFLENPGKDTSVAAIEQALRKTASGPSRFQDIKEWATHLLESTIFTGNTESPYCGIHFFCAFNFFDEKQDLPGFPSAQAFVPVWQVSKKDQFSLAIANCIVEADTAIDLIARRILGAHQRFASFPYRKRENGSEMGEILWGGEEEVGGDIFFEQAVSRATRAIDDGEFAKIVLARAIDFKADKEFNPLKILDRLRNRFPNCYTFSYSAGAEGTFLGATPELLIRVKDGQLQADAIAGSIDRGKSAGEDAALGSVLLSNDKNAREHQAVINSIVNRLSELGLETEVASRPRLLKLPNVQHLFTPIHATLPTEVHVLDIIQNLHPTSAVGGSPRASACRRIPDYESFVRGPYGGPVGWFDARGDGEFVVGIRSGLLRNKSMRLFSGAGIVRGSLPENEKLETDLKFKAMRQVMD